MRNVAIEMAMDLCIDEKMISESARLSLPPVDPLCLRTFQNCIVYSREVSFGVQISVIQKVILKFFSVDVARNFLSNALVNVSNGLLETELRHVQDAGLGCTVIARRAPAYRRSKPRCIP
jgi:hypothetical protein